MKHLGFNKWDKVEIIWVDSQTVDEGSWTSEQSISDSMTTEAISNSTIGYFVTENDQAVGLCQTVCDEPDQEHSISGGLIIPKSCIVEVTGLP